MTARLDSAETSSPLYKKYLAASLALAETSLSQTLRDLVNIRASQINGCAFCVDMHIKEATIHGERPLRLHHIAIWRESPLFDARERAALAWTEIVTKLPADGVSDQAYAAVREQFDETATAELTFAVLLINGWNRLSIAFRSEPGSRDALYGLTKAGLS